MTNSYPSDWDTRRKQVYQRDDFECQNCGRTDYGNGNIEFHAHHIVPKSKGGTHKLSNLITLCKDCHDAIHTNKHAPSDYQKNQKVAFKLLKQVIVESKELMSDVDETVNVTNPGKFGDAKLERRRISLIQKTGRLSIVYNAPDVECRRAMEELTKSLIFFFRFPEDGWEKINPDGTDIEQTKKHLELMTEKRSEMVSKACANIQKLGMNRFFEFV